LNILVHINSIKMSSDDEKPRKRNRCYHHPGNLDVDWDSEIWDDHDEDCHGKLDSNRLRREFPEGYIWSCCGESGGETKGCTEGKGKTIEEKYPDSPKIKFKKGKYYHDGILEVDWDDDFWADHDEDIHGEIDTNTMRRQFPEGFKWSCCEEVGTFAKGCKKR
jgi:hypothetical protein